MKKTKMEKKAKRAESKQKFLNKLHDGGIYGAITKIIQVLVMCFVVYVVVAYTAVGFIPYIGGVFIQAMGITTETMIMDLFILWMVHCLFVVLMVFAGELVAFRYLWKFLDRIFGNLRRKRRKELEEKYPEIKDED